MEKQPWGNTLDVTKQVEAAIEALRPGLKDVDIDPTIFRPATFIVMVFYLGVIELAVASVRDGEHGEGRQIGHCDVIDDGLVHLPVREVAVELMTGRRAGAGRMPVHTAGVDGRPG